MSETAASEAQGIPTLPVEWEGTTLEIPTDAKDWDVDAVEAFENGKAIALLRAMFTSAKYDEMKANFATTHGRPLRLRDLDSLLDAVAAAAGFANAGE